MRKKKVIVRFQSKSSVSSDTRRCLTRCVSDVRTSLGAPSRVQSVLQVACTEHAVISERRWLTLGVYLHLNLHDSRFSIYQRAF